MIDAWVAMALPARAHISSGVGWALFTAELEELAGAPWAPDPPRGRGVSSDVARLE